MHAWFVSQELMLLYRRSHDLANAKHRLWRILDRCARSEVPELLRLARTLDAWQPELLAAFTATGKRGVNALIKKVKKIGHGFRNLDNYRLRLLLAPAWTGAPSSGRLRLPPRSEDAHHAWWRRALNSDVLTLATPLADPVEALVQQAGTEVAMGGRLLATAAGRPQLTGRDDVRDLLIEARLHVATADNHLDLLQIRLERVARTWEVERGREGRW